MTNGDMELYYQASDGLRVWLVTAGRGSSFIAERAGVRSPAFDSWRDAAAFVRRPTVEPAEVTP